VGCFVGNEQEFEFQNTLAEMRRVEAEKSSSDMRIAALIERIDRSEHEVTDLRYSVQQKNQEVAHCQGTADQMRIDLEEADEEKKKLRHEYDQPNHFTMHDLSCHMIMMQSF
jgi:predicted  nucleic acid-binding Zn-ribbon protein